MSDEWRKYLQHAADGRLTKVVGNVALILKNAPGFAGCLTQTANGTAKWAKSPTYDVGLAPPKSFWIPIHNVYIQHVLVCYFGFSVSSRIVTAAVGAVAHDNNLTTANNP
jgi:hypothetical protein